MKNWRTSWNYLIKYKLILVDKAFYKVVFFCFLITLGIQAQVTTTKLKLKTDSLNNVQQKPTLSGVSDTLKTGVFKPDPVKVVWMGAIIPGYGQILNKKYWKLPIVYGGFMGCAYAISWNDGKYQTYKTAYRDILLYASDPVFKANADKNPGSVSFLQILPKGYTVDNLGGVSGFTSILKTKQDGFRRYRDLSIILSVGYYALTLVDAYVDAQLSDFDISPDLSLRVQPTLINNGFGTNNTLAMQCSFRFK